MLPLRPAHHPASGHPSSTWVAWDKVFTVALGVMLLATGTLFMPHVTTQFGVFATLFLAVVVVGSVVMHVRDRTAPPAPR